jgi:hypothetical protein
MSPVDSGSDWEANDVAQITILGTTNKKILAGTFKYQIFETEVKSFISSGDSPFFQCNNKGCDPTKGVALKFKSERFWTILIFFFGCLTLTIDFYICYFWLFFCESGGTDGAFDLSLTLALPAAQSTTKAFKLVLWGTDQDHTPYDFSASIAFEYGSGP